jgi:hypothetical protein
MAADTRQEPTLSPRATSVYDRASGEGKTPARV